MSDSFDVWAPEPGDVVLEVPAEPSSLRVVRMVAATVAADAGFDIDAVDDVRMAVDELCAAILESRPSSPIRMRLRVDGDGLVARADAPQPDTAARAVVDRLRAAVLGATADSYRLTQLDGHSVGWLVKRSVAAGAARSTPGG